MFKNISPSIFAPIGQFQTMKKVFTIILLIVSFLSFTSFNPKIGQVIDSYNGVSVYFNGSDFTHVIGRNKAKDGYNLGLKYQCVEFIKRYYYEVYDHRMPNSYGHAREFFDQSLPDKAYNFERGLVQFRNTREYKPQEGDIIVYNGYANNPFGHVGIITEVGDEYIEYVQQNFGTKTRQRIQLVEFQGIWSIADYDVLGWMRMPY